VGQDPTFLVVVRGTALRKSTSQVYTRYKEVGDMTSAESEGGTLLGPDCEAGDGVHRFHRPRPRKGCQVVTTAQDTSCSA
jgi:hypothetical protein